MLLPLICFSKDIGQLRGGVFTSAPFLFRIIYYFGIFYIYLVYINYINEEIDKY